jgi:pyrimidine operon attenuation protein/uracil phosphoribosyltransferase
MEHKHNLLDAEWLVQQLAERLRRYCVEHQLQNAKIVGIQTGGVWVAERLQKALDPETEIGTLNINFYRDDFSRKGLHPVVEPSNLPFDVNEQNIILVDDVLHTGRTIRAAMNELFDYGRPASIHLVVLVERNGRELPIQPDLNGHRLMLAPEQHIKLSGPSPLVLDILET